MKELRQKNEKELKSLLLDQKNSLQKFRFAVAGSKTRNIKEGQAIKKNIAKIKTILNEKN